MTIMIVGEAWGEEEEREQRAFVGSSGRLLRSLLHKAGINPRDCYLTNVFNLRPAPTNDVMNLCGSREEGIRGRPELQRGKYIRAEYAPHLDRLFHEIETISPRINLAVGATAAWALLNTAGIKNIRGRPMQGPFGIKVLPTVHPAAVLRERKLLAALFMDVGKLSRDAQFPEVRRPVRFIHTEPTYDDILAFEQSYMLGAPFISLDVETSGNQITCLGVAPTPERALVIPFTDDTRATHNYWNSVQEEVQVWNWVKRICTEYDTVGQNFNYDITFLWRSYGIPVPNAVHDTMLLHHALQPELEKSLGFLASLYTEELSWKFMRPKHTIKRED